MSMTKPIATTRSATGIPTGKLAVWWVIGSEIVIFGGLLASYIMHRLGHPEWAEYASHTNPWFGGINTFVLLTSSLFAVLAHYAAEHGDGKKAAKWLLATCGGGAIFAGIKAVEWTIEITHGYTITANGFWSFYYTAAGIHALHVIAGCIIMLIIANDARKGLELHRVELIGIYWHFVDIVWIFLFPLLYIAK
ncbi:MAG: cytochrome c oxidase subunit 3 [Deltaproteobacteria bacterium]|jgi:heme/copper-type cytochrome/quinol oxidase subunit 3|nr:cytochrome c oxidase subunit 3 [Deltaproteobacteria bacterium]